MKGTLHEEQYIYLNVSRPFVLRMSNVSDKSCRGNQITYFTLVLFSPNIYPIIKIMWEYVAETDRPQMTI
jgi:hypothetical protein